MASNIFPPAQRGFRIPTGPTSFPLPTQPTGFVPRGIVPGSVMSGELPPPGGVTQLQPRNFGVGMPGQPQFNQPQGSAQAFIPPAPTVPGQAAVPINPETGQNFPVGSGQNFIGPPPATGLIGAEQALIQGAGGAVTALEAGGGQARQDLLTGAGRAQGPLQQAGRGIGQATQQGLGLIQQGIDPLSGFSTGGQQAFNLQAALLGAQGPEAQAAAFQNFRQSPGQQFLQEEQERAIIRNAAATGGLQGGNVRQELQRRALGRAEQAFGNRISQLGGLAGQGLQAAGQVGQLRQAGADLAQRGAFAQGDIASLASGIESDLGVNLAQLEQSTGINVAQVLENLGSGQAEVRDAAGVRLAQAIQTASNQLSGLQQQQGAGIADIGAGQIQNIGNLLIDQGQAEAQLQTSLSTLLANLSVGAGTNQAVIQSNVGNIEAAGILGQSQIIGDSLVDLTRLLSSRPQPTQPESATTAPPGVFP